MASYDSVLEFTQKVLKNFNFHSSILTEDELEVRSGSGPEEKNCG